MCNNYYNGCCCIYIVVIILCDSAFYVIYQDCGRLYTGPGARKMVMSNNQDSMPQDKWDVFVQCEVKRDMKCIDHDATVLYQV